MHRGLASDCELVI